MDRITLNTPELQIAALSAGEGPLMLLVHGFPDTPYSFHRQLEYFAACGYRVVAPWLRGYAPSSQPEDGAYGARDLGQDLLSMINVLGYDDAVLIGHDWGAAAANAAALMAPNKITHLVTSAVPYGRRLMQALTTSAAQQRRSWYLFFFQTQLAEAAIPANDFELIRRLWRDWSTPDWQGDAESLRAVIDCFSQPGSINAALQYYRQAFGDIDAATVNHPPAIEVPALYLHGEYDGCIGSEFAQPEQSLYRHGCEFHLIQQCGHFVHLEQPDQFNSLVQQFITD